MTRANQLNGGEVSPEFLKMLKGYGLTTAEIVYRRPDYKDSPVLVTQTYVWQEYDLCPHFPVLHGFLKFWRETLEGPLLEVKVGHSKLVRPAEFRAVDGIFRLN